MFEQVEVEGTGVWWARWVGCFVKDGFESWGEELAFYFNFNGQHAEVLSWVETGSDASL